MLRDPPSVFCVRNRMVVRFEPEMAPDCVCMIESAVDGGACSAPLRAADGRAPAQRDERGRLARDGGSRVPACGLLSAGGYWLRPRHQRGRLRVEGPNLAKLTAAGNQRHRTMRSQGAELAANRAEGPSPAVALPLTEDSRSVETSRRSATLAVHRRVAEDRSLAILRLQTCARRLSGPASRSGQRVRPSKRDFRGCESGKAAAPRRD